MSSGLSVLYTSIEHPGPARIQTVLSEGANFDNDFKKKTYF